MRKVVSRMLIVAVALGFASLTWAGDKNEGSWTGFVTDTHCGAAKATSADHAACAARCVKEKGAKWALYNPQDGSIFVLSGDDAMMEKMASKKVTVKGSMDKEKKVITVANMEQGA